jgi:PAS domain S-box-containing protein
MQESLKRESLEHRLGDKWLSVTVDPVLSSEGELCGSVHIIRDITERKQRDRKQSGIALRS